MIKASSRTRYWTADDADGRMPSEATPRRLIAAESTARGMALSAPATVQVVGSSAAVSVARRTRRTEVAAGRY